MVDASNTAVGAVLQQQVDDDWQPISFFSRSLSPRRRKYNIFDRELLATFLAVKHFQHHLHDPNFHILTDHKPLIYAINSLNTQHSTRQARQLDYIFPVYNGSSTRSWGTESCRRCPFTCAG